VIYEDLIIQKDVWNKLNNYSTKRKLPNAFLFHGNNGSGKEGHAIEFAALINCNNIVNQTRCGECHSCKKIKKLQYANLKFIHPLPSKNKGTSSESPLKSLTKSELENYQEIIEKKSRDPYYKIQLPKSNTILVNSIRHVKKDLSLSNIEKGWNIIIILEAEKLCYPNNVSANALLKILEEPPEKTLFILITSNYSYLIDTIKSRCQNIFFSKIPIKKLYKNINNNISDMDKNILAHISDGDINLIRNLESEIDNIYKDLKLFINSCYSKDYKYNNEIIQKINLLKRTDNSGLLIFFRIIMIYFKDLFVFAKSKDIKYLVFKNLNTHYEKIINHHVNIDWELCINIIENTLNNIYRNASIPLSISGMLIDIHDAINQNKKESFSINNWLEIE